MKKNILLLLAICIGSFSYAQNNFISTYFSEYETDSNFDKVNVTSKTFDLFAEIETNNTNEKNVIAAISKLEGIKVLYQEKTDQVEPLRQEAVTKAEQDASYEELIKVETQNENFLFMIREEDVIKELTVIAGDKQHLMIATLFGEIDLKNISKLVSLIKDNGKEWFKVFENIESDELVFHGKGKNRKNNTAQPKNEDAKDEMAINVYPNPVSSYVQLEAIGNADVSYNLEFFSIIGESVKNVGTVRLPYKVQLEDLPSGAYFLRLTNAEGTFKNFRIVKP